MSNLIEVLQNKEDITPEQNEALYVHHQIKANCRAVCEGLVGIGRNLKEMRDKKLYLQLGYKEFTEYTEAEHGIKQRMAYNYINAYEKLGVQFLQSNANLGITKLVELATLDREERDNLLAAHPVDELEAMSSEKVKQLTEEIKNLKQQLSFLQDYKAQKESEPAQVTQQPFKEIEAEIRAELERELAAERNAAILEYEAKIAELESQAMSDEELKAYKQNAEKEAKAAATEEVKRLKADLKAAKEAQTAETEKLNKILEEKKQAEERAIKAEEQAKHAAELEEKINAAEAEKAAIEKKIKLSSDPELTRFKFLFEQWQASFNAVMAQLEKLDGETQAKMKKALKALVEEVGL